MSLLQTHCHMLATCSRCSLNVILLEKRSPSVSVAATPPNLLFALVLTMFPLVVLIAICQSSMHSFILRSIRSFSARLYLRIRILFGELPVLCTENNDKHLGTPQVFSKCVGDHGGERAIFYVCFFGDKWRRKSPIFYSFISACDLS